MLFRSAHGRFPIPAPATLNILAERGIAITQCEEPNELITPTGAALIAEFAEDFGPLQNLTPEKVGFGLGTRDCETRPNVLRAVLGEEATPTGTNEKFRPKASEGVFTHSSAAQAGTRRCFLKTARAEVQRKGRTQRAERATALEKRQSDEKSSSPTKCSGRRPAKGSSRTPLQPRLEPGGV